MKRLSIIIITLLSLLSVSARTICGEVRSDNDSTAVIGASCRLMSGNQFIDGITTDANGNFELSTSIKGAITLRISMTGYNPTEIVIDSDKNINVGTIYLSASGLLNEVQVTANTLTDVKGRTVIFPSVADVKASSTTISLFQKLPLNGLDANPVNRSISVDGGTPVILINGIPSTIDDLNGLQPKDIAKIEFSRITPARYADRGNNGFLNITLKKRNDGGQVYIWGRSAVNTAFVDGNMRASYHQGPSQFTLSYNPSWRNYHDVFDNSTESYIGDDFRVNLEEHDRNPFYYHTHNVMAKYDFSPNINTLFSATMRMTPFFNKSRSLANTLDSFLGDYENINLNKGKDLTPSLDLFFKRDFNDNNSLEVQLVGTLSANDYRRANEYLFSDGSISEYIMDVDSRRRSLISEICYSHQFSNSTSLSAGYQNTISHSTNTYLLSDYKPVLTENNNYVYARFGQQLGKLYLSLSTGAKLYWIKNDLNKRHFVRNLSTVQLSWNISKMWNLAAAFQYSPSIPSLSALTDYPQQLSPYLISNGSPDLKVSQNFMYQLMPSFQYKKFNASLLMNYRNVADFVMDDMFYLGDRLFLSQSINAKNSHAAWANLNLKLNDIRGFGVNLNLGLSHYRTEGTDWSHKLTSFNASINLWWNKGPYTISYWRKIPGKYLSGNYVGKDENGDALSFQYQPDKHWSFNASWMYMFDKKGTQYPSWGYSLVNPYYKERYIKNNGNMVVLSVSYSADFGSIFRSSRRSLNNSDNNTSLLKR
ncbi:MAG: carboxypeptidase-like regulatory domain-containing protein [Muribaculaceae bacterium]|nr:carboxypeptidase-like regulatory domain-containing protein [Muribaculaceae bacterium]